MSKKRSITKKINLQLDFPLPDTNTSPRFAINAEDTCIQDTYFGENLKSTNKPTGVNEFSEQSPVICESVSEDEDFYSVDWSKSSGSSTSGSDNLETEATQKLSHEFEKIERILYNEQAPVSCDENEIKQWKTNFPHLRVSGHAINIPCYLECSIDNKYEEVIAEHCDSFTELVDNTSATNIKNYIKETVINNIVKDVQRGYFQDSPVPSLYRELKVTEDVVTCDCSAMHNETKYVPCSASEPLLQVSSMPLHNSPMPFPKYEYQSPLMRSHISALKWQRENSVADYSSLPQIANSNVPCSTSGNTKKQRQTSENKNRYSANLRQKSSTSAAKLNTKFITASSPRTKNITLPPIQNLSLSIDGDKSVSSTPRKYNSRPVSHKLAHLSENKLFYNNFKYLDK